MIRGRGAAATPAPGHHLASGLFGYAAAHWWTGEWDAALARATDIARAHDDSLGLAWMHRRTAVAHGTAYRDKEALDELERALQLFTERGDRLARASTLATWPTPTSSSRTAPARCPAPSCPARARQHLGLERLAEQGF
ncbi:hypothetical protein [Streptomyces sp. VRA16 Mangrove soil]|uniref:hypothetical protein n=1 Tax=Streptomyces sp. VRA16 Mangrove soil TaxID=2817434 RepID=UPI001A9E1751|nr:hypothetical protein [Streptomyces sp. VRA16 Mangrove soil]MBO1331397.1 hypothetical protein [Streptomyces sp. VRA16 Mangrove soil]